jgi:Asp-tRNA(Asn)/Glu-tRNA(Gln) amidotransferase A subunit family amidase
LGLVPTDEVFSGEPSLDVVGPLARTAADCSMMLACLIEGSLDLRTEPRRVDRPLEGVTFGFPIDDPMVDETTGIRTSGPQWEAAEPALRAAMERWLDLIGSLGARLVPFEFGPSLLDPHPSVLDSRVPEHVMRAREQARGYRGGLRSIADQLERHDPGAAAEIRAHVATLDAQDDPDPTDADYARATAIVADEQRRVTRAVATAGLNAILILEVGSQAPPRRGADSTSHAVHRDRQTLFNVLGWPIVNLPIGWTPDHMPVSVQLAGTAGSDARLLALATDIQGATGWHDRPPVAPVTPHRRAGDPRS